MIHNQIINQTTSRSSSITRNYIFFNTWHCNISVYVNIFNIIWTVACTNIRVSCNKNISLVTLTSHIITNLFKGIKIIQIRINSCIHGRIFRWYISHTNVQILFTHTNITFNQQYIYCSDSLFNVTTQPSLIINKYTSAISLILLVSFRPVTIIAIITVNVDLTGRGMPRFCK